MGVGAFWVFQLGADGSAGRGACPGPHWESQNEMFVPTALTGAPVGGFAVYSDAWIWHWVPTARQFVVPAGVEPTFVW